MPVPCGEKEKNTVENPRRFLGWGLTVLLCCEASAAKNGLTLGGLEGHLALRTALSTNCGEHFSLALLCILLCSTAVSASGRLVLKALGCIELLLTSCEHKFLAAFFADESLVFVHLIYLALVLIK